MKSNNQILLKIFFFGWLGNGYKIYSHSQAFIDILLDLHIHVPPFMMM